MFDVQGKKYFTPLEVSRWLRVSQEAVQNRILRGTLRADLVLVPRRLIPYEEALRVIIAKDAEAGQAFAKMFGPKGDADVS